MQAPGVIVAYTRADVKLHPEFLYARGGGLFHPTYRNCRCDSRPKSCILARPRPRLAVRWSRCRPIHRPQPVRLNVRSLNDLEREPKTRKMDKPPASGSPEIRGNGAHLDSGFRTCRGRLAPMIRPARSRVAPVRPISTQVMAPKSRREAHEQHLCLVRSLTGGRLCRCPPLARRLESPRAGGGCIDRRGVPGGAFPTLLPGSGSARRDGLSDRLAAPPCDSANSAAVWCLGKCGKPPMGH